MLRIVQMVKRPDLAAFATLRSLRQPWSVNRISTLMGAFGVALILAATSFIAWKEHATALREAREHAERSAFFLADHAARLFEVADIALRSAGTMVGSEDWDAIAASRQIWSELRAANNALPYIGDLWLNDAEGHLRLTTFAFPAPASDASDRNVFQILRRGTAQFAIGDPFVGRLTDTPTFLIARRLETTSGMFRGMVSATADLNYFYAYWKRLDLPNEEQISLVRDGMGAVLASYPALPGEATQPQTPLLSAVAQARESGAFVPAPGRIGFYHRVGSLPLYVTTAFTRSSVEGAWWSWLWRFIPFPLAALLALAVIMMLNIRQSRTEAHDKRAIEEARADLASANQGLEERVAERTLDLKESNEEIQRFAYIVSHDLRAPLVNIMGFTSELQNLRGELFAPTPGQVGGDAELAPSTRHLQEDFDEAIGFIQSSIDKMDRLIKAILLLSRQGQRTFQLESIDMDELMRSVTDSVAHSVQTAGATVAIGALPSLVSDRIAIEQVFSNLVENAVKYLRPEVPGRIVIEGFQFAGKATFTVRDNGRGIAPRDRARVFELFRRSGPQDQPGEGIGLAHVRSLVRRLGGTIMLDSTLGEGSTFTVVLPLVLQGAPS